MTLLAGILAGLFTVALLVLYLVFAALWQQVQAQKAEIEKLQQADGLLRMRVSQLETQLSGAKQAATRVNQALGTITGAVDRLAGDEAARRFVNGVGRDIASPSPYRRRKPPTVR